MLSANIPPPGNPGKKITQKLDFEYWKEGHHLVLVSKENDRSQINLKLLSPIAPDFFSYVHED